MNSHLKACCASRGFSIDESIMDEPPSEKYPNAQFSIGNEFGDRFRSQNETHFVQPNANDNRPNLWSVPKSNWAELVFEGINCHHTNEKNWIRAATTHVFNSQFSDNTRAWINKGTGPVPGAHKLMKNVTFDGFTKNTGHKTCSPNSQKWSDSRDLATIKDCMDNSNQPLELIDERPQQDVLRMRKLYWFKVTNDVYRSNGMDIYWPTSGFTIYDTHIPLLVTDCKFYNFPSEVGGPQRKVIKVYVFNLYFFVKLL